MPPPALGEVFPEIVELRMVKPSEGPLAEKVMPPPRPPNGDELPETVLLTIARLPPCKRTPPVPELLEIVELLMAKVPPPPLMPPRGFAVTVISLSVKL